MNGDGSCTVTPGLSPADGHTYSDADFRALGAPVVKVADNAIGTQQMDPTVISAMGGNGKLNYFTNPNFNPAYWPKGTGPLVSPTSGYTELATGWAVKPSAGRVTQQQSSTVTTITADARKSVVSLQILGDSTCTGTIEIKQDILRYLSASLRQTIAVSFHIYNVTGASITPSMVFSTPNAADTFSPVVQVGTKSCGACPSAVWTKVSLSLIDASAWANLDLGLRVALVLPSGCLNSVGKSVFLSQFDLELTSVTAFVPRSEPDTVVNENYFSNGNFDLWAYTGATAASGNAPGWYGSMVRSTDHPLAGSSYSAKLTGTGSAVDYGQTVATAETKQNLTFSCWIYNASAVEVTPTLRADLAGGGANQFSATLTPCPVSVWTKLTATIPAGSYAITETGLNVYLRMTVTNTQSVYLAQMKLEPGSSPTRFRRIVEVQPAYPFPNYQNLKITTGTGGGTVTVTADEILMRSAAGLYMRSSSFGSSTISYNTTLAVGGRDYSGTMTGTTWHYVYAVADKDGVTYFMLSKSSSAPTLPTGYLYYHRLGALMADSTSTFSPFLQSNNMAFCARQTDVGGFLGTTTGATSYGGAAVTNYVPPIAKVINGIAGVTGSGAHYGFVITHSPYEPSPDLVVGIQIISGVGHTGSADLGVYFGCGRFQIPYSDIIFWKTHDTTANKRADITGWTL